MLMSIAGIGRFSVHVLHAVHVLRTVSKFVRLSRPPLLSITLLLLVPFPLPRFCGIHTQNKKAVELVAPRLAGIFYRKESVPAVRCAGAAVDGLVGFGLFHRDRITHFTDLSDAVACF